MAPNEPPPPTPNRDDALERLRDRQQHLRDLFARRGATVEQIADLRAADCELDTERRSFSIRFARTPDADELCLGLSSEESAELFLHLTETGNWVTPELHVFSSLERRESRGSSRKTPVPEQSPSRHANGKPVDAPEESSRKKPK